MPEELSAKLSKQGLILYKEMKDHHNFLKRQQWVITNYGLVIYAAIVGLQKYREVVVGSDYKMVLTLVILGVAVAGIYQLSTVQKDIVISRKRIDTTESKIFDKRETDLLGVEPTPPDEIRTRENPFLFPLYGAFVVGAGLAISGVWFSS
jgi:hypothetical protein